MSQTNDIIITLSAPDTPENRTSDKDCPDLVLEQRPFPRESRETNLETLFNMINIARAGYSSKTVIPGVCPYILADPRGEVTIRLPFYIWPSEHGVNFSLTSSFGEVVDLSVVNPRTEFSIPVESTKTYDIGKMFTGTLVPESPCFNEFGAVVGVPGYQFIGTKVEFESQITCAFRASGQYHGFKAFAEMTVLKKNEDGSINKIENPVCVIKATWDCPETGGQKSTQLSLDFPECVTAFLSACDDGRPEVCFEVTYPEEEIPVVFYSTCTGKKIGLMYLTQDELSRLKV